jgi:hypothetical protein
MSDSLGVYTAINQVQKALCKEGIVKGRNNQQHGYSFRGIDDVFNALSPLLAEHGLCILPNVLSRDCVERQTKSGSALFYVVVEVEFHFVSSMDGSRHIVKTFGEAMDSADKATNKAMSAAYKYAALQAFSIPTEGDNDADAKSHEVAKPKSVAKVEFSSLPIEEQEFLRNLAMDVLSCEADEAMFSAYLKAKESLDSDQNIAFWSLFDSTQRSIIKRIGEERKKNSQQQGAANE